MDDRLKHAKFVSTILNASLKEKSSLQDTVLVCRDGRLELSRLIVGLVFPLLKECMEFNYCVSNRILLPLHSVADLQETVQKVLQIDDKENTSGEIAIGIDIEEIEDTIEAEEDPFQEDTETDRLEIEDDTIEGVYLVANELDEYEPVADGSPFKELFPCEFCGIAFADADSLKLHMKSCRHSCILCPESFGSAILLREHLKTVHSISPRKKGSSPDKIFPCETCHKVFPLKCLLERHSVSHSQEKSFQCRVCGKSFALKHNLKVHERIHSGQSKIYPCRYPPCDRKFSHTTERKDHEGVHTGDKPFQCPYCPQRYQRSSNLWKHKQKCVFQSKLLLKTNGQMKPASRMTVTREDDLLPPSVLKQKPVIMPAKPVIVPSKPAVTTRKPVMVMRKPILIDSKEVFISVTDPLDL